MSDQQINILLAFVEGLGLIVSPCILPILPIVLSASLGGSRRRPYGIILGFMLTFAIFTFFSRRLVQYSGIDLNLVRYISFAVLILLGWIMISDYLSEKFGLLTRYLATVGTSENLNESGSFTSGILFGCLIALIWTPCAGPILAAVIVQTVLQKETLDSFLVLVAFGLGAGIPMLLIALFGRYIMLRINFLKKHTPFIRKILGVIIIGSVVLMLVNEGAGAKTFSYSRKTNEAFQTALINPLSDPYPAPAIDGITAWINSAPLNLEALKGKVVLLDFWTYSCINCLRTLPYIKSWDAKYRNKGLVIIGIHSPEFEFEKDINNVKNAVLKQGIKYPVALDSNFVTWQNYNNRYWPAHYLIDKNGEVVYQHFGEGEYDVTENNIRFLLGLNEITSDTASSENLADSFAALTPETYLGFSRADHFASPEGQKQTAIATYTYPEALDTDYWALKGSWQITAENIVAMEKGASLKLHFNAKDVYVILGAKKQPASVTLRFNGENIVNEKGNDVINSMININGHRLYHALSLKKSSPGILEITANEPGIEIYTFTFGS